MWAAVIAGAVGALVALPTLRLSGIYLALATASFAVVLDSWLFNLPKFNIGPINIKLFELGTIPVARLHVPFVDPSSEKAELVVMAAVFCVCALLVVAIRRSYFGERLLAMKDSPAACATLGLNLRRTKLLVFSLSAAIAGVGGALYGATLGTVSPDRFSFFESLPLLLLAVVGGIGSAGSAIFAGLVLYGIPLVSASIAVVREHRSGATRRDGHRARQEPERRRARRRRAVPASAPRDCDPRGAALSRSSVSSSRRSSSSSTTGRSRSRSVASSCSRRPSLIVSGSSGEDEEPLEWVGVDRPFTADDVRRLDAELGLERTPS